ncbi:hypothetical protein BN874_2520012 [Candidatus Contendobacter odensis Run_B_J11]|uniref:Uncharacterized protein n=1 Tax=Candidatus Contendobacter odensis Run_B_J11 TaxID=1400861 RepID=A0A7U7GCA4_9GAMM|nr:hypothetical protein [Candidatus Contendobacter odensis]CDH45532.1 hypothetical protein BN874_2520012 [Candidatus Contendobacter odensis Run_B_J11]
MAKTKPYPWATSLKQEVSYGIKDHGLRNGSENKVAFVAAVSLNAQGHPLYTKMIPVPGLTCTALTDWAKVALAHTGFALLMSKPRNRYGKTGLPGCLRRVFGRRYRASMPLFLINVDT